MRSDDLHPRPAGGHQPLRTQAARAHLTSLRGLPPILESFGVACDPILKAAKLNRVDLEDPTRSAPFSDFDRLVGLCVRETKCAHFGLLIGQYLRGR